MEKTNILLLGSGGRESALAWKLASSPRCGELSIAPGNGGTGAYGTNVAISPMDFEAVATYCREHNVQLLVAGNEDPLVAGIYDYMRENMPGVLVLGPSKGAARLEGSKDFAKDFMTRHGIPTAAYRSFTAASVDEGKEFLGTLKPPYVLKADGLAAGKGVLIIDSLDEARKALDEMVGGMFGHSSDCVVIEEFLSGIECSVFVLTDGNGGYRILPVAKDYKRRFEGDKGPNTGGMGAVSPVPFADAEFMGKVEERIIRPTIDGLMKDGLVYRGFIFLGLINCGGEPKVIEYNVRMGDPETEVVMPRLDSDLVELGLAAAAGNLGDLRCDAIPETACTVIAVSDGYPGSYPKGLEITGDLQPEGSIIFQAGTKLADGRLVTSGGRVMAVTSLGGSIEEALERSYGALRGIHYEGISYRSDIGRDLM